MFHLARIPLDLGCQDPWPCKIEVNACKNSEKKKKLQTPSAHKLIEHCQWLHDIISDNYKLFIVQKEQDKESTVHQ